jgi:iron complex outermembrane receptor protein
MNVIARRFSFVSIFLITWILAPVFSLAQDSDKTKKSVAGTITGKIADAQTRKAISFSTVTLIHLPDSTLASGALSGDAGIFVLENIKPGSYCLKVKFMGYSSYVKDSLLAGNQNAGIDLGLILLLPAGKQLQGVDITGTQDAYKQGMEKKEFSVDNDLNSKGGSAADVIRNIPSLSLDIEGNLTLRGSGNITVLIDGRPSGMLAANRAAIFDMIPSSSIERIELITNPSAKYDPDGVAGIINIVLKKNRSDGLSMTASASYSTYRKGNASGSVGYHKGKLTLYADYSYRYNQRWYQGYTNRINYLTLTHFSTDQNSDGTMSTQTQMGKLAIDYAFNSRNSISVSGLCNRDQNADNDLVTYKFLDQNQQLSQYAYRNMLGTDKGMGYDTYAGYRRTFANTAKLFTLEAAASGNQDRTQDSIHELDYYPGGILMSPNPVLQKIDNKWSVANYFAKTDYISPVGEYSKLETGLKVSDREINNNFQSQSFSYPLYSWQNDVGISNVFVYSEQIYSGYATWTQTIHKFGYQLGGRVEDAIRNAGLENSAVVYKKEYANFFPGGYLSWKPGPEQELRLGYSRRINRPLVRNLNPFPDYTDPLNLRFGNPNLDPEYIDAVELSWLRYFNNISVNASLYYRHTTGVIQIFKVLSDTITGATSSTYVNLSHSDAYGAEITSKIDLFNWWNLVANLNGRQLYIDGSNINPSLHVNGFCWFGKLSSVVNIRKNLMFQISGVYYAPIPTVQSTTHSYYTVDAALRTDLMKGRAGLSLGLNDIFNTSSNSIDTNTPEFTQNYYKKKESRIATLTFFWRLGAVDNLRKRKNTDDNPPSPQPEIE